MFMQYLAELYNTVYYNKYIQALVTLVLFFVISKIIVFISQKYITRLTRKTKSDIDDLIIAVVTKPISLLLLLFGIKLAAVPLQLAPKYNTGLQNIITSCIILIFAFIGINVFTILINNWGKSLAAKTHSTVDDQLVSLLNKFSKIVFLILGILLILDAWGVEIAPLLASLGIAGVAVAFALQSTLGNIFGGISLIVDKSIKVGDVVELDKDTIGTVLDVGLRSTKIKTFNNEVIILPNGKLADTKIINYVLPDESARLVIHFSVAYGSDIQKVKDIVTKEIIGIKGVLKDPEPFIRFREMASSSLDFNLYVWCNSYSERFTIKDIINTKIYNAFNKHKVSIPFPQLDVNLKKN